MNAILNYVVLQYNNLKYISMNKTTSQVLADMRRNISLLEAINNGSAGNRRYDESMAREETIKTLKHKLTSLNKSNGQFKGITERKGKQVLRLQTENAKLLELVASLQEEITGYQGYVDWCKEHVVGENEKLKTENQGLRDYLHGHSVKTV